MSRFKLPFNDRVEVIWNEDGRYGAAYPKTDPDISPREDTFDGEQAQNLALNIAAGTTCAVVAGVFFGPMLPIIAPLALFNELVERA